ncbi:MAG TPA: DUF488 domain-containing protein [Bryobacteraceae bacterium]|nr:DUF488 domain-containing protein [Bryobacteraceae bacterium]
MLILTVGHSNRGIQEFLDLLLSHQVEQIIDVRTIPKSRHNPQFNHDALDRELGGRGIGYLHMPGLGGLRHPRKDSINTAWQNAGFRGYADYMQTPAFDENLRELIEHARARRTAILCAEAVPWRCHRSLIGDALLARGIEVEDILSKSNRKPHTLTPFAKIDGESLTYPGI